MAMAQMGMPNSQSQRVNYSSDGLNREDKVSRLLAEANAIGLAESGFFYTMAGTPVNFGEPRPSIAGIELVDGTEIVAQGPFSGGPKRIKEKHPMADIYVGGRLVA
jgi:hypothetical protein